MKIRVASQLDREGQKRVAIDYDVTANKLYVNEDGEPQSEIGGTQLDIKDQGNAFNSIATGLNFKGGDVVLKNNLNNVVDVIIGPKYVIKGRIFQDGTNAPVWVTKLINRSTGVAGPTGPLYNTFPGSYTWTRNSQGEYWLTFGAAYVAEYRNFIMVNVYHNFRGLMVETDVINGGATVRFQLQQLTPSEPADLNTEMDILIEVY